MGRERRNNTVQNRGLNVGGLSSRAATVRSVQAKCAGFWYLPLEIRRWALDVPVLSDTHHSYTELRNQGNGSQSQ